MSHAIGNVHSVNIKYGREKNIVEIVEWIKMGVNLNRLQRLKSTTV
jgi:hypothetical protein